MTTSEYAEIPGHPLANIDQDALDLARDVVNDLAKDMGLNYLDAKSWADDFMSELAVSGWLITNDKTCVAAEPADANHYATHTHCLKCDELVACSEAELLIRVNGWCPHTLKTGKKIAVLNKPPIPGSFIHFCKDELLPVTSTYALTFAAQNG